MSRTDYPRDLGDVASEVRRVSDIGISFSFSRIRDAVPVDDFRGAQVVAYTRSEDAVHISFASRQLRDFCNEPTADLFAGLDLDRLKARLADLDAVQDLTELVSGRPNFGTSTTATILIPVSSNYRFHCRVNHVPAQDRSPVSWKTCHWIMVESLQPLGAPND